MKVSLVVSDLSGGGAIRAFLLGQVLKKLNYEVEVIGFQFGQEIYAIPPQGFSVYAVPGENYPGFVGAAQKLLQKIDGIYYLCGKTKTY